MTFSKRTGAPRPLVQKTRQLGRPNSVVGYLYGTYSMRATVIPAVPERVLRAPRYLHPWLLQRLGWKFQ